MSVPFILSGLEKYPLYIHLQKRFPTLIDFFQRNLCLRLSTDLGRIGFTVEVNGNEDDWHLRDVLISAVFFHYTGGYRVALAKF